MKKKQVQKQTIFSKVSHFFSHDLWSHAGQRRTARVKTLIHLLRVIVLAFRGFVQDNCYQKASALTYYSLLAIVPIVAMAFGFAKGFGFDTYLYQYLQDTLKEQEDILLQVMEFSESLLAKTQGGVIAGIGFLILVWSVIKVLGNVEMSFNQIWYINKQRSFIRKISDYMTIMIFAPILFIISNGATIAISEHMNVLAQESTLISHMYGFFSLIFKLIPYSLIWLAFSFLYIIMPNTKVSFSSALTGGIIAGIIFQLVQFLYVEFQVGVSKYNAIYGSFAALPLFLIWLQTSWTIVLLGAEIAYATQNVQNFEYEVETETMSVTLREKLCIWILNTIVTRFDTETSPPTSEDLCEILDIPHRMVKHGVVTLLKAGLINEIKTENEKVFAYAPAIAIQKLSFQKTLTKLRNAGTTNLPFTNNEVLEKITPLYENISEHPTSLIKDI